MQARFWTSLHKTYTAPAHRVQNPGGRHANESVEKCTAEHTWWVVLSPSAPRKFWKIRDEPLESLRQDTCWVVVRTRYI